MIAKVNNKVTLIIVLNGYQINSNQKKKDKK